MKLTQSITSKLYVAKGEDTNYSGKLIPFREDRNSLHATLSEKNDPIASIDQMRA